MNKGILKELKPLAVALPVGIIVVFLSCFGFFEQAEFGIYDAYFRIRGAQDPGDEVVIVAIDEKSVNELGPLPWPRRNHAELLENMPGAGVVAFDLIFDFPLEQHDDRRFSGTMEESGNVILASMFSYEQDEAGNWYQSIVMPHNDFLHGAAATGFINVPVDRGNIIRKLTFVDSNLAPSLYPAFSLAVALRSLNIEHDSLTLSNGTLLAENVRIPLDRSHQTLINFWGPGGTFPTYSYADVISGKIDPETWDGKVVLVGVTTPAMMDYFENPFTVDNLVLSGSLPSAGVEIHASAVQTILSEAYYSRASRAVNVAVLVVVWLLSIALAKRFIPAYAAIAALLLAGSTALIIFLLWVNMQLWVNLFAVLAMIAFSSSAIMVDSFVHSERERRWVKETFSRYVSDVYVEQLIQNPDQIKLGGEKREVTVMFADLRNFTAFSDKEEPELVLGRLNEFFGSMADIIFQYGGTLDKYLGDGFMVIFGAPIHSQDHAAAGLNASIDMLVKMEELNRRWQERGEQSLEMGIGLNSGTAIIGNIGSETRMDYTAIGRVVNLAARLEELTKTYGVDIIIGDATISASAAFKLPPGWSIGELGPVSVPGISGETKIFTLKREGPG